MYVPCYSPPPLWSRVHAILDMCASGSHCACASRYVCSHHYALCLLLCFLPLRWLACPQADLSRFDTIFCYLSDQHMVELAALLDAQIVKQCIVVSSTFEIIGWPAYRQITLPDSCWQSLRGIGDVFVYRIRPAAISVGVDCHGDEEHGVVWQQMAGRLKIAHLQS